MAFDALTLRASLEEMQKLTGGRIQKIYQTTRSRQFTLSVYRRPTTYQVLVSTDRQNARIHLTRRRYEHPKSPSDFCMTLRKHLQSGHIRSVKQQGWDRIARIYVESHDDLGRQRNFCLIAETMGRFSNLILVDADEQPPKIIAAQRLSSADKNPHRTVLPGHPYKLPPQKDALNLTQATAEDLRSRLEKSSGDALQPAWLWLVRNVEGPGPQLARTLLEGCGIDPSGPMPDGGSSVSDLAEQISWCAEVAQQQSWEPWMKVEYPQQGALQLPRSGEYGIVPHNGSAAELRRFPDVSYLLDAFHALRSQWAEFENLQQQLKKELVSACEKVRKKIEHQKSDLARAEDAEKYKKWGELLTASMHQVSRGQQSTTVPDYYNEGQPVKIPLDPKKSPADNASSYFAQYRKMQRTQQKAKKQILRSQHELRYLDSLLDQVQRAESLAELQATEEEAKKAGYLKQQRKSQKKQRRTSPRPFYVYTTPSGARIMVGRNNRGNDHLTTRKADPEDYWFHVQDIAGAHVIVPGPWESGEIPEKLQREAATLAAFHSAGRHSSNVAVDYTLIKYVNKPRGAKPGMVTYRNHKTVFVTPPRKLQGFSRERG